MSVGLAVIFSAKDRAECCPIHLKKVLEYHKKLKDCIRQTNDILFPMSVMFANDFSALSKMLAFEDARDQKLMETYFSTDEIEHALNRMCIRIIFVSHQWLACAEHCGLVGLRSIRQNQACSGSMQAQAISSLPIYDSLSQIFVVVAPKAAHSGTGMNCDMETYKRRLLDRVELFSHYFRRGRDAI